jgi:hypothetical protein
MKIQKCYLSGFPGRKKESKIEGEIGFREGGSGREGERERERE